MIRSYKAFYQGVSGIIGRMTAAAMLVTVIIIAVFSFFADFYNTDPSETDMVLEIMALIPGMILMVLQFTPFGGVSPGSLKIYRTFPDSENCAAKALIFNNIIYLLCMGLCTAADIIAAAAVGIGSVRSYFSMICFASCTAAVSGLCSTIRNIASFKYKKSKSMAAIILLLTYGVMWLFMTCGYNLMQSEAFSSLFGGQSIIRPAVFILFALLCQLGGGYIGGKYISKRWFID